MSVEQDPVRHLRDGALQDPTASGPELLFDETPYRGGFLDDALTVDMPDFAAALIQPGPDPVTRPEPPSPRCGNCGAAREPNWAFCGGCGLDLPGPGVPVTGTRLAPEPGLVSDTPLPSPNHHAQRSYVEPTVSVEGVRRGSGTKIAAVFAIVLVILGLTATGGAAWVKLSHTQDELAATRSTLQTTKAQLTFANDTLDTTRGQLNTTEQDLSSSEDEVTALQAKLENAQGSLNHAQDRLDLQAGQIDTLQSCLGGVTSALSDLASGYVDLAVSDLQAVEGDCNEADSML